MLKTAVVGLGWWGRQIVTSLQGSEEISVTDGVDVDMESAAPFAAEKNIRLGPSYDHVLADAGIDAVILATPHGLHETQVMQAASAGKQIFCEKPLALSAAAAERMLAACDAAGITLGIGHERRFEPALEELHRMAGSGELGTIQHLEVNWSHNLFAGAPAAGWRQDKTQAPAGTLTALGVHITDFMQTIAGPVAELTARMSDRSADFPGEDIISVQFLFAGGITGTMCNIAATPFYQRISVFGDRGWAESREVSNVDVPDPAQLTWRGMDEEIHSRTYRSIDTVRMNLDAWAGAIAGGAEYRFTRAEKLHNVEILEAIVKSASGGGTQSIGSGGP
jgi:predicted dehydrogenase